MLTEIRGIEVTQGNLRLIEGYLMTAVQYISLNHMQPLQQFS